jgi:hypothetical protein
MCNHLVQFLICPGLTLNLIIKNIINLPKLHRELRPILLMVSSMLEDLKLNWWDSKDYSQVNLNHVYQVTSLVLLRILNIKLILKQIYIIIMILNLKLNSNMDTIKTKMLLMYSPSLPQKSLRLLNKDLNLVKKDPQCQKTLAT